MHQLMCHHYPIALTDDDGLAWDTSTGDVLFMLSDVLQVAWSPDESKLAVERTDHTVWVMSNTGQILYRLQDTPIHMDSYGRASLTWSPDSHQLAYNHNGVIDLWRFEKE